MPAMAEPLFHHEGRERNGHERHTRRKQVVHRGQLRHRLDRPRTRATVKRKSKPLPNRWLQHWQAQREGREPKDGRKCQRWKLRGQDGRPGLMRSTRTRPGNLMLAIGYQASTQAHFLRRWLLPKTDQLFGLCRLDLIRQNGYVRPPASAH